MCSSAYGRQLRALEPRPPVNILPPLVSLLLLSRSSQSSLHQLSPSVFSLKLNIRFKTRDDNSQSFSDVEAAHDQIRFSDQLTALLKQGFTAGLAFATLKARAQEKIFLTIPGASSDLFGRERGVTQGDPEASNIFSTCLLDLFHSLHAHWTSLGLGFSLPDGGAHANPYKSGKQHHPFRKQ